jgi:hypothetical protein
VRRFVILLAACSSSQSDRPAAPSPGVPPTISNATRSCKQAALGLENATRGVRAPESTVADELAVRCNEDSWPSAAIDCFAEMREGDLGRCSKELPDDSRNRMFGVLAGSGGGQTGIAIALARLEQLQVGVPACDRFITAVSAVLKCELVPIEIRVQLGQETAELWSLPTARLAPEDVQRMTDVCGASLASLEQQASDAGCK